MFESYIMNFMQNILVDKEERRRYGLPVALTQRKATATKTRHNPKLFVSVLLKREWASCLDFFFFTTILTADVEKGFLMDWPLTKNFGSSWRQGHLGLGRSRAQGSWGVRCRLSTARQCAPSYLSIVCLGGRAEPGELAFERS